MFYFLRPAFLPDPKDGSIYMIGGGLKEPLKKLPFTIPELVAASPCKSSDGILYTGKKVTLNIRLNSILNVEFYDEDFIGCSNDLLILKEEYYNLTESVGCSKQTD